MVTLQTEISGQNVIAELVSAVNNDNIMKVKYPLFFLIFFLCCSNLGFSEGTAQIMPTNTGYEKIEASSPSSTLVGFAYYSCPPENRLNIHVKEVGEVIYYGFNKNDAQARQFRIRDPNGLIVVDVTNIPTAGTGFIDAYGKAVAGPSQIVGTSGYDAMIYTPLMAGDYYMEFYTTTGGNGITVTLKWFDITVASAGNVAIPGRVWSKAWQFDTGQNTGRSYGTYYIYTDDGLVSSMALNGLQGITFTVACNQVGCPVVSVPGTYTRKSVNGKQVFPQYKIFLNDPDITVYPTGTLGQLSNLLVTWNCDGTATITFDVTKAGDVDILLDINPLPGVQPEDTLISSSVNFGPNTFIWHGHNGLGAVVPNGTTFNITVTYILGLTNFPVYDVEANTNGLVVNLVRPTGGQLLMYWDDTQLSGTNGCTGSQVPPPINPISNYTGCVGSTGCHIWTSVGGDPGQCSFGNERTVNTYWYAVYSSYNWPSFIEHRFPGQPAQPSGPLQVCPGDVGKNYSIPLEPNSTTYTWEFTGTGATFNPPNPTGTTATLDFAVNATSGQIRVRGWNATCGNGPLWSDYTSITVNPVPQLTNSQPNPICSGQNFQTTLISIPPTTDFSWTVTCSPPGIFVSCPPSQLHTNTINDPISITGFSTGTVTYHIVPASAGCEGQSQDLILSVKPLPDVTITPGPNSNLCSGQAANVTLSSTFPATSFTWPAPVCNNIQVPPGAGSGNLITDPFQLASNLLSGSATYSITPEYDGCSGNTVQYSVIVNPLPEPNLPAFAPLCLNTPAFTLNTGTPPGGTYTLAGNPITIFNPAVLGIGIYPITYTVVDGNGCIGSDEKDITVQGLITPSLIGNSTACLGVSEAFTTDPGKDPASYQWSVAPDGNLQPGANPWETTITWSSTSPPVKTITVTYTDPNSGCTTTQAIKTITVNPLPTPTIDATGNFNACFSKSYVYTTQAGKTNYSWNVSPGNTISFTDYTATVTWNVIGNEWIEVNYFDANGCTAASPARVPVVVNPSPVYAMAGAASVCAGSTTIYSLQSPATGNWSMASGGSFTSPANNVNSVSVTWASGTAPAQSSITVNCTNALGCDGITTTAVDIQPLPVTTFSTPTPSPVCQDFPTPSMYTVDPGGVAASYQWQVTPASYASIADPTANPASITWKLTGNTAQTALLTLTATTSGTVPACSASSNPVAILINPKPNTQLASCFDLVTTRNAKPFLLKGGTPLGSGGKYYIDGTLVTGGILDPSNLSQNNHTISFIYTDVNGCQASDSKSIAVYPSNAGYSCMNNNFNDPRNADPATNKYPTTLVTANGRTACWMLKNLNWGTSTPSDQSQTDNCINEKYCLSTDDAKCSSYGGLYQWDELIQYGQTQAPYQGLCPPAWHIPTTVEWQDLIDAVAKMSPGDGIAGDYLNGSTGFNALAEGVLYQNISWAFTAGTPSATMFWTSTLSGTKPIARGRNSADPSVSRYESSKANAFPVRCVKD